MVEYEAMEKAIMCQVAGKLLDALPEDEKKRILAASLEKTLHDMFRPWQIEQAIKDDVNGYIAEYVKEPEVQKKIREETRKAFDILMKGVIDAIVVSSQDTIKSEYRKFIDPKKE